MKCAVKLNHEDKIRHSAIKFAVKFMLILIAQYLGDKRGWKPKTICQAISAMMDNAESIGMGNTTIEEAEEDLKESYGIYFDSNGHIVCDEVEK